MWVISIVKISLEHGKHHCENTDPGDEIHQKDADVLDAVREHGNKAAKLLENSQEVDGFEEAKGKDSDVH